MSGAQYVCRDPERRELARAGGRNGVDFLEVLDLEAPAGAPPQRTLLVHFLAPLADDIAAGDVAVVGGARITGIGVQWTARSTSVDPTRVSPPELAFYSSLATDVLIVRTDRAGDHSTYTLAIDGLDDRDFDPLLAAVPFSFKAECLHDFDCAPDTVCPPTPVEEPQIDYLARDYGGLRRLLLDRLSVVMPEWTDRSQVPDVQVALVEAMAYVGDRLSYFQDAVATEAYIGTAHQRTSLRRHGRLLDYRLHDGTNARVWIHLEVDGTQPVVVPTGTQFMTRLDTDAPTVLPPGVAAAPGEPHPYDEALALSPVVFEAMVPHVVFAPHNSAHLYTWGDAQCCLPAGSTRATLLDDPGDRLLLRPGDVVVLEQVVDHVTGLAADADPARRHAVRLTSVTPEASAVVVDGVPADRNPGPLLRDPLPRGTDPGPAIVEIAWDEADALPFSLCLSAEIGGQVVTDLALVRANIVAADHGRTLHHAEELRVAHADRPWRPVLAERDVTFRDVPTPTSGPATAFVQQQPREALPAIALTGDGQTWEPVLDLLNSDRFASDVVVETGDDRAATLRFGDGVHGRPPTPGTTLSATYRVGNGAQGNVGRGSIAHAVLQGPVTAVRNPLPAVGGTEPEPATHVRLYAPEAFRTQERAVTEADYAEVTERRPDVQKAAGTRRWTGSWHTMFVTVDRAGGGDVDADLESQLRFHLDRYRLAGQDVEVDGPRFVPLDIALRVCVSDGYFAADVRQAMAQVLSCTLLPDGTQGFFHPDRFTFADTLYLSVLVAAAMAVDGVDRVDVERFHRWGEQPQTELADGRIVFGRLEIPQVENDANAPENGRLELTMAGGA